ncbi:MAG: hypothetical protein ACREJW_04910, partial [Candidatus Methylomirabilales bacterium]
MKTAFGGVEALRWREEGLVVAVVDRVCCVQGGQLREVTRRSSLILTLCFHEGRVYDGGRYGQIYDTVADVKVADREDWVLSLCSHRGVLYDAGSYQ